MVIRNDTEFVVHYRLSGGPTDMTFSEAELDPGEHDEWRPPVFQRDVQCHVHFHVAEGREDGLAAGPWSAQNTHSEALVALARDDEGAIVVNVG